MSFYLIKIAITTILIVVISEVAKRSSLASALLASIPIVSLLAIVWLYIDTKDIDKVVTLSNSIFWLVLPSLVLFIVLPLLLKHGFHFYASMSISVGLTIGAYWLMIFLANFYDIKL